MSTTSIQQIRPVIECFCQILSFYGFSPMTSEIFRLAKFNRNEATVPLWRLIFEIIHFDPNKPNQKEIINKFDQTPKDILVNMIKNDLFTYGYTYEDFLMLDNKMESGSQQLLICVGWLIYQMKLIEKCIEKCLNTESILDYDDTSLLYKVYSDKVEHRNPPPLEKDLMGQIKQAMRINSKLRFRLRRLHGLVIENANLHHQIHECHNMSSLEAYLCQHPHLLSHHMIELENEHRKLSLLNFWTEHQNVFWKWMESVLDETPSIEQEENDTNPQYEPLRPNDRQRLEAEKRKFTAAIDTLDSALGRLEELCISNNESIENDISSMVNSIDTEVTSLFHQLLCTNQSLSDTSNSDKNLFLHEPHRLVYSQKLDSTNNSNFIKPKDFECEKDSLQNLQTKIDQHVEKQKTVLDTISQQFQNVMIV